MSAPAPLVLGTSAVLASPVAWMLYDGSITLDAALFRVAVVVAVSWLLLSLAGSLLFSPAPRPPAAPAQAPDTGSARPPGSLVE